MAVETIEVDANGFDADGIGYDNVASQEAVSLGYMFDEPVHLKYPDGRLVLSSRPMLTAKGLEVLLAEMDMGDPEGAA